VGTEDVKEGISEVDANEVEITTSKSKNKSNNNRRRQQKNNALSSASHSSNYNNSTIKSQNTAFNRYFDMSKGFLPLPGDNADLSNDIKNVFRLSSVYLKEMKKTTDGGEIHVGGKKKVSEKDMNASSTTTHKKRNDKKLSLFR